MKASQNWKAFIYLINSLVIHCKHFKTMYKVSLVVTTKTIRLKDEFRFR